MRTNTENETRKSIADKILNIDSRVIWWILIALLVIPLLRPLGLPIPISDTTKEMHNYIDSLPEGTIVGLAQNTQVPSWPDIGAGWVAITKQLFSKNQKLIFWSCYEEGSYIAELTYDTIDLSGKIYGVDYVNFGWVPGTETGVAALAFNVWDTFVTDAYGTPISELPIMEDIRSAEDMDLVIVGVVGNNIEEYARHWNTPYGTPLLANSRSDRIPQVLPYYEAGACSGYIYGALGGAEYEILTKRPGEGVKSLDAQSMATVYMIGCIVMINLFYFIDKSKSRGRI